MPENILLFIIENHPMDFGSSNDHIQRLNKTVSRQIYSMIAIGPGLKVESGRVS